MRLLPFDADDFLTSQTLQQLAHWRADRSIPVAQVRPGDRLYSRRWRESWPLHERIPVPYHLLSNCHDESIAGPVAERYLADDKILSWIGVNAVLTHPKLHAMPRGLWCSARQVQPQVWPERDWLLYANFTLNSPARVEARAWVACQPWAIWRSYHGPSGLQAYRADLARSRFVMSPPGHGWDCWRTWEALACGAIPVLLRSPIDTLYHEIPVLIVDTWEHLTPAMLEAQEAHILTGVADGCYPADRLRQSYWKRLVDQFPRHDDPDAMPDADWHPQDRRRRKFLEQPGGLDYFPALTQFIRDHHVTSVVEIGVRLGYSMAAMLRGNPVLTYLGIDDDRGTWGGVPGGLRHAEVLRQRYAKGEARFLRADSQGLTELPQRYDLAYVDGDHSMAGCLHDLALVSRHVHWILIDDYDLIPTVRAAVQQFAAARGWPITHLPIYNGWALLEVPPSSR